MTNHNDLTVLEGEYDVLVAESTDNRGDVDWDALADRLVQDGDWTCEAALHLICLVQEYGWFMLRNAAALAIAADVEDGRSRF
jgi:hypothetical protein